TVLVWKLDRFARDRYDSATHKNTLKKHGVRVVSVTEHIAEDSTGILLESLLEGYAEYYSAELSEKVIRGMTENAYKCKYNGGGIPVGYYIDDEQKFQIDASKAVIVRTAFQRYADGETIKELVDWFNEQGVLSYRNHPLRIDSMQRLLKNRRYVGEYHYRDIVVEDGIPAIIDKPLFDKVQERMAKNKKAPARFKAADELYILTTKLHCGYCESFMVGESGTGRNGIHQYYKCVSVKKRRGCKKKTVRKGWIEDIVVRETTTMLHDESVFSYIIDMVMNIQRQENTTLPMLRRQLSDAEKGIENILDAIQQGILTSSTKQRLDDLEETKSKLEIAILQEEMEKPSLSRDQIAFFLDKYRKMDVSKQEERQRLIDTFINAIYLFDDKIVLTFNYKDGTRTVSLDEIENTFGSDLGVQGAPRRRRLYFVCGGVFYIRKAPSFIYYITPPYQITKPLPFYDLKGKKSAAYHELSDYYNPNLVPTLGWVRIFTLFVWIFNIKYKQISLIPKTLTLIYHKMAHTAENK
ncbi:MAG: recombinase family protein, partial [Clostridiales bacterium]|nr:recombinase family protein [Clostridiales bacterium]